MQATPIICCTATRSRAVLHTLKGMCMDKHFCFSALCRVKLAHKLHARYSGSCCQFRADLYNPGHIMVEFVDRRHNITSILL